MTTKKGGRVGVKRQPKKQKGGALINGHLVSRVSHKVKAPSSTYDAAKDTFLDMPPNPLPVQSKHQAKGVLNDELSTNLHMKR